MDCKSVIPCPLGRVQRLLVLIVRSVEAGFESVLGAAYAEETLSGEVDLRDKTGGAGDVVLAVEFWVGRPCQKAFDFDVGKWDQVVFVVGVQVEDGMADLPNVDGAVEGYFLAGVALGLCWPGESDGELKGFGTRWQRRGREKKKGLELTYADAVLVVPEVAGCYRWMMAANLCQQCQMSESPKTSTKKCNINKG
jgi:hypothetical protein